jgi:GH24 family phage-related lysozyme (muramidase)
VAFRRRYPWRASEKAVSFIGSFEGLRLTAYKAHPSEPFWTIGYGHYGPDVKPGMRITRERARELLHSDLRRFEKAVVRHVPKRWRRHQRHFDALVSVAFNLGEEVLTPSPPLESLGRTLQARLATRRNGRRIAAAIRLYDRAGGERLEGLTRRRNAEARLFLSGSYDTD